MSFFIQNCTKVILSILERLENLPDIKDVKLYLDILENMGASVERIDKTTVIIDTSKVTSTCPDEDMARKMRGSSYLIGALLGRS